MALLAASVDGLNLAQWRDDTNSSGSEATASSVDKLAKQKNVQATPTIYIGCTGGKLGYVGAGSLSVQQTEQAISAANCQ
jgi:protein-disulfide isomerase